MVLSHTSTSTYVQEAIKIVVTIITTVLINMLFPRNKVKIGRGKGTEVSVSLCTSSPLVNHVKGTCPVAKRLVRGLGCHYHTYYQGTGFTDSLSDGHSTDEPIGLRTPLPLLSLGCAVRTYEPTCVPDPADRLCA